ncbi:hypothetical protein SO802_009206 [Lithocarpus litseifolius]|uniref:Uncharacterized protein n=1 Tax=Lithocarpus litseifolius TaxID=425828 RepID=A0AAW2DDL2_9ROSI
MSEAPREALVALDITSAEVDLTEEPPTPPVKAGTTQHPAPTTLASSATQIMMNRCPAKAMVMEDEKREFKDAEAAIVDLVGEIMSKADSGNRDSILEDLVNSDETFILILKNLKYCREEDISSLTFFELDLELAKVKNYMVSLKCAHILETLIVKCGDIFPSSTSNETFTPILKNHNHTIREKGISRMKIFKLVLELVRVRDYMVTQNCAHIVEPLLVKFRDICAISTSDEIFIPILNMIFLELELEVVEVRDYMVSRKCAPILESLFDKYGDIRASSTSNPRTKMRVLNIIGGVAQSMCNTMVKDITSNLLLNWWKNLKLAQHVGFNVQFAFDHFYRLAQAQFCMECEFKTNFYLLISQREIEELPTKLEVLKDKQKQLIRSIKRKSILEKDHLI